MLYLRTHYQSLLTLVALALSTQLVGTSGSTLQQPPTHPPTPAAHLLLTLAQPL